MATLTYSDQLVVITCGDCAIPFALPKDFQARKASDGTSFWCPNGHKISYRETETQRLERQLRSTKQSLEYARASVTAAHDQAAAAERSARAYKGVATRVKKRTAHGVCPAPGCKRSFADVARHMAGQHPEFVAEHGATS